MQSIKTPTTFELIQAANALVMALTESEGELDERSEAMLESFMAGCGDKLGGIRAVMKRCENDAAYLDVEAKRLLARRTGLGKIRDRMRRYALDLLTTNQELTGESKVKTATYTAYLTHRQSVEGPKAPEDWPAAFREEIVTTRVKVDKSGALKALKAGQDHPELQLITNISAAFR